MQQNKNLGYMAALGCYVLWGILPLYWHLLAVAEANEILAHRILWSVVFMLIVLVITRRWELLKKDCRELRQNKKRGAMLVAAAVIISLNWLTYIWAVNHNHVIDTSIGYYINPLVNVLFGVTIFGETLSAPKKTQYCTGCRRHLPDDLADRQAALGIDSTGSDLWQLRHIEEKTEAGSVYQYHAGNTVAFPFRFLLYR